MKRAVVAMLMLLTGCLTAYGPSGFGGGYTDQRIGRDRFFVDVNVNGYTSASTAYSYFVRRAAELCTEAGFADFAIEDKTQGADEATLYRQQQTQFSVTNNAGYTANGYVTTNEPVTIDKPYVHGIVRCSEPVARDNAAPAPALRPRPTPVQTLDDGGYGPADPPRSRNF